MNINQLEITIRELTEGYSEGFLPLFPAFRYFDFEIRGYCDNHSVPVRYDKLF